MTNHKDRTFVIVGASLAGALAVQTLRGEGFDGRVVLIGAEPHPPYERPPLSFAFGFGDLSVHEVAVDPQDPSLAYLSYYSGGLRAIQIRCAGEPYDPEEPPADASTCELVEVGGYLDPEGNDFWGVETFIGEDGQTYILASDRDSGLWIFRDP